MVQRCVFGVMWTGHILFISASPWIMISADNLKEKDTLISFFFFFVLLHFLVIIFFCPSAQPHPLSRTRALTKIRDRLIEAFSTELLPTGFDSESTRCRKWIRHPVCFWVELLFCFNWAKGQSCSNTMCSVDLEKINSGCGTHDDINWLFIWQLPNRLFSTDVVFSVFLYFCDYTHGRGSFTLLLLRISKSEMSGMRTFSSPHTLFYFILFF